MNMRFVLAIALCACSSKSVAPEEPASTFHPAAPSPRISMLPPGLIGGTPGDLADQYCAHLEQLDCHQREACPFSVRQRQRDHLHSMHEGEVLAATTKEAALATGVVVCFP